MGFTVNQSPFNHGRRPLHFFFSGETESGPLRFPSWLVHGPQRQLRHWSHPGKADAGIYLEKENQNSPQQKVCSMGIVTSLRTLELKYGHRASSTMLFETRLH